MCPAQFMSLEKLFDHMKEEHQGTLFPDKPPTPRPWLS